MDGDLNIIIGLATTKVDLGRQLIANVAELGEIDGVARIREQINEEINVLLNVSKCNVVYPKFVRDVGNPKCENTRIPGE